MLYDLKGNKDAYYIANKLAKKLNYKVIVIKESAKFIVSSYYHNKENTNVREVENTVALLLSEYRKVGF